MSQDYFQNKDDFGSNPGMVSQLGETQKGIR